MFGKKKREEEERIKQEHEKRLAQVRAAELKRQKEIEALAASPEVARQIARRKELEKTVNAWEITHPDEASKVKMEIIKSLLTAQGHPESLLPNVLAGLKQNGSALVILNGTGNTVSIDLSKLNYDIKEKICDYVDEKTQVGGLFNPYLLVQEGQRLNRSGECKAALPFLEQAYKIAPHEHDVDFELAFAHNSIKNYKVAATILRAAIQHDPQNYVNYREMGYSCLNAEKLELAVKCYSKGLELCPQHLVGELAEMAFNLGTVYNESGDIINRNKWWLQAWEWAPEGSPTRKKIQDISDQTH